MKVKEFIEILKQYDPELDVYFNWDSIPDWGAEYIFRRETYVGIQVTTREDKEPEVYKNYPWNVCLWVAGEYQEFVLDLDPALSEDEVVEIAKKEAINRFSLDEKSLEDFKENVCRLPDECD